MEHGSYGSTVFNMVSDQYQRDNKKHSNAQEATIKTNKSKPYYYDGMRWGYEERKQTSYDNMDHAIEGTTNHLPWYYI